MIETILDKYNLKADVANFGRRKAFRRAAELTDLELILEIAGTYGKDIYCRDKKVYVKDEMMLQKEEIIYEWGKNLIEFQAQDDPNGQVGGIRYQGWDKNKREGFWEVKKISEIEKKIGGGKDWTKLSKDGESRIDTVMDLSVADRAEAAELALGMLQKRSFKYIRGDGRGIGNHELMAGDRVKMKQVGPLYSGEYIAENVTHLLTPEDGYVTEFTLKRNTVDQSYGKKNIVVDRWVDEAYRERAARKAAEAEAAAQAKGEKQEEEDNGPEYRSLKWKKDGKEISEALVDDVVALTFEVKNIPDGETVKITVWESDEGEENPDDEISIVEGTVSNGRVEIPWTVEYHADDDDTNSAKELEEKGYTLPEYYFVAEYNGVESEQGKLLYVKGWVERYLVDETTGELLANQECALYTPEGKFVKGQTDANGIIRVNGLPIGKYSVIR